jgi:glutathione synthase/RimK-type ligase-like ATP-grasp enzyme
MRDGTLVLLWGLESDPPLVAVREQLHLLGVANELVDQRQILDTDVQLNVGESIDASLRIRNREIDLNEITAIYVRPYDSHQLPEIANAGPQSLAWQHATEVDDILASWSEITSAFVVNRLGAMASNNSKPYQLQQIQNLGFSVPETLITNDPIAARAFWERHGTVIYKSVSAVRSRVARLRPEHVERLGDLSSCPTQFQQWISGTDHRVHVVGDEVFASEVLCGADDYRYPDQHPVEVRACCLPEEIENRSRRLARALQLSVAGVDLRRTPDGEWFCFEVNPSPAFTYYEEATGQPIAYAIARLLANGPLDGTYKSYETDKSDGTLQGLCRAEPLAEQEALNEVGPRLLC